MKRRGCEELRLEGNVLPRGLTKGCASNPAISDPTFESTRHLPLLFPGVFKILKAKKSVIRIIFLVSVG